MPALEGGDPDCDRVPPIVTDFVLPLPPFRGWNGVDVRCFVDGASRALRQPRGADAAVYRHCCTNPTVVGEWWWGGGVPCFLARAARELPPSTVLSWDFDVHGPTRFTMSHHEARTWRKDGHSTARCGCNAPRDCPLDRFIRLADAQDSGEDSDW